MEHGHHHEHSEDHHGEHGHNAHHDMNHQNHASPQGNLLWGIVNWSGTAHLGLLDEPGQQFQ